MHITHLHCEQNSMPYIENAVTSLFTLLSPKYHILLLTALIKTVKT